MRSPGPASSVQRLQNVDRIRILAILAVIWYHMTAGRGMPAIFRIGLASFLLVACMFRARRPFTLREPGRVRERARRLLVPWLFACLIYGLPRLRDFLGGAEPGAVLDARMLLYGTAIHLWFLPFLFAAEIAVSLLRALDRPLPGWFRAPLWTAAGVVWLTGSESFPTSSWLYRSWAFGLAAVPLGMVFAEGLPLSRRRVGKAALAGAAAALAGFALLAFHGGLPPNPIRYAAAGSLLALALTRRGAEDAVTRTLVPAILGIYLLHPLVAHLLGADGGLTAWIAVPLVFAASLAATLALRRTPFRRFV